MATIKINMDMDVPDEIVGKLLEALAGKENPPGEIHLELVDLSGKIALKVVPSIQEQ
jgi:hypothetical protein